MPVTYCLDCETATLNTCCAGQVTFEEVLAHFDALAKDETLLPSLDLLLDLSAQETAPDGAQVRQLANRLAAIRADLAWGRCAIVVSRDVLFGIARMFGVYTDEAFVETQVFRDPAAARDWLAGGRDQGQGEMAP